MYTYKLVATMLSIFAALCDNVVLPHYHNPYVALARTCTM